MKLYTDDIVYLIKYFIRCQLVPPEAAEETYERMSPRYVTIYKKNNF